MIMGKNIVLMVLVILLFTDVKAQFESSTVSIPKQEYFNPAYNAYKSYKSLNMVYREQWTNGLSTSPKIMGVNYYMPIRNQKLGLGGVLISEEIGLREINTIIFSISKGVRLSSNSYLSVGVGVGGEFQSYMRSKMRYYPDVDISRISSNQVRPSVSMGLLALFEDYFIGVSTNLTLNKNDFDFTYITGFDFVAGKVFIINPDLVFRSMIIGKYYKETRYISKDGKIEDKFIPPVINYSVSCFLYNRIWIGFGIRFDQSVNSMVNFRITPKINLGYKFEKGIGTGLNRFNSQGVYITYNFRKLREKKMHGDNRYEGVFMRGGRLKSPLNEYLY